MLRCWCFCVVFALTLVTMAMPRTIDGILGDALKESGESGQSAINMDNPGVQEEDMLFTAEQWALIVSQNRREQTGRARRKVLRFITRWPAAVVPYDPPSDSEFSPAERAEVQRAMDDWQKHTCLRFREAEEKDTNRLVFTVGRGCYSYIGMVPRLARQGISLAPGCRVKRVIVHEIGHAVGYLHEQSRPDRDDHVTILFANIQKGKEGQFRKYGWNLASTLGVAYDFRSIMHYGGKFFSKNGDDTIRTKDPEVQAVIGNARTLSFRDIKMANLLYDCSISAGCDQKIQCPGEGFVDKSCKCMCPGNPVRPCRGSASGRTGSSSRDRAENVA